MDPKQIEKLSKVLRDQGDKLLTSEFKFTLTGELLRALNDSFSLIIDENEMVAPQTFQVAKPNNSKSNVFRELMFIHDFVQKTLILKLCQFLDDDPLDESCVIDIAKFRNLKSLEIQRIPIMQIRGLQVLRSQISELVVERSLTNIKDLIQHCAGDKSNGFIWNNLKRVDFSYNELTKIDNALEFTPYMQHLNLSHNRIIQISALVWLPNLKILNLSYNQLTTIPKFNTESYRRLQVLIISDNCIEDVSGLVRLDALQELDVSNNFLLDHSLLLPLCTLNALRYLNLAGNPLAFHPKHRVATCRYLSKNAATVQFQLDSDLLSKHEKSLTGSYENYYPIFGHRMTVTSVSTRAPSNSETPTTKSLSNTPENCSLDSVSSHILNSATGQAATSSNQKRIKARCVVIEEAASDKPKSPTERRLLKEDSKEHLVTKREIEQLREQFGSAWLFNQGNVMGFKDDGSATRQKLLYEDLLSSSPALQMDASFEQSDPIDTSTPEQETVRMIPQDGTMYQSVDDSTGNSFYASALDETFNVEAEEEIVISDAEDSEAIFIVDDEITKEQLFLVVSAINIREKDPMNGRTLTKWGISTLESCERTKSDLIRLNFDTIRKDKRERQYRMDEKYCQQLEKYLRDVLSSRPLSAMNQTVYKCPRCNCQFSREIDVRQNSKKINYENLCPSCGNKYVVEIHKTVKCETTPPKSLFLAGNLFQQPSVSGMLKTASSINIEKRDDDIADIPRSSHSHSSIESAFDSNQSVAGSSVEVLSECSSQISHASQTSQSSIEVLDSHYSRKPSEERRISQAPSLDTIDDDTKADDNPSDDTLTVSTIVKNKKTIDSDKSKTAMLGTGNVNLTESSSSGSVCESVCTAYEQNGKKKKEQKSPLEGIFIKSSALLSKTPKTKKEAENVINHKPIQYNYENLSIVDHRVKLFLFQNVIEDNEEKLIWLVKCITIEDDADQSGIPSYGVVVMTTRKIYSLKIFNTESDDVEKWLKKSITSSIEGIQIIREMPWKIGITFSIKGMKNIHLLLHDDHLTNRLRKHIAISNQNLEISEAQPKITENILTKFTNNQDLKSVTIFTSCHTTLSSETDADSEISKLSIKIGCLIVTSESLHMTSDFQWLCDNSSDKLGSNHINHSLPMTSLVELYDVTKESFTLKFLHEAENTIEQWKFVFESYATIQATLERLDAIWSELFKLPLITS